MKKIIITLATVTVIILFFFTGCKKDIRDKYIGDWEFVTEIKSFNYVDMYNPVEVNSISYLGKIALGDYENHLVFQFAENDEIHGVVNKDGVLALGCIITKYLTCHRCSLGHFEKKNKVFLEFFYESTEYKTFYNSVGTKKGRK